MRIKLTIAVLIILIVLVTPFIAYFLSPIDRLAKTQSFLIEKGQGVKEIAQALKNNGFIKSPAIFVIYSALSGFADKLKAGHYELSRAMSLPKIVFALRVGPKEDVEIVVREGERLNEIENDLVALGVLKKGALSKFPGKSLEGFLFPDTYRFFPNSSVGDVVKKFLTNFNRKAMPILGSGCQVSSVKCQDFSVYELLTVASLIEKEVPFLEDRYLVAGLLYKRLEIGMPLQVDAWPWTYEHYGLPSKPISNPGAGAILAAANPKSSPYLYYLSDPKTKKTIFGRTFEEHIANKFKYLKR